MVFGFPLLRAGHESGLRVGAHRWGQLAQHRADPPGRYSPTISIADICFSWTHSHTLARSHSERYHKDPDYHLLGKYSARGNIFGGHVCASWSEVCPIHGRKCPTPSRSEAAFFLVYYLNIDEWSISGRAFGSLFMVGTHSQ